MSIPGLKFLAVLAVLSCAAIGQEASGKKVVSVGANNADLVSARIRPNALDSLENRKAYMLALYQAGKLEDAVTFYSQIDRQSVTKVERMTYVKCLLSLGKARDAYIQLKALDDPKKPDVNVELLRAKILIRLKEWKAARSILEMITRVAPDNPEGHYYYALTCPTVGDYDGTIVHCNRVWELVEPNSKLAKLAGALMLVSLNKRHIAESEEQK